MGILCKAPSVALTQVVKIGGDTCIAMLYYVQSGPEVFIKLQMQHSDLSLWQMKLTISCSDVQALIRWIKHLTRQLCVVGTLIQDQSKVSWPTTGKKRGKRRRKRETRAGFQRRKGKQEIFSHCVCGRQRQDNRVCRQQLINKPIH